MNDQVESRTESEEVETPTPYRVRLSTVDDVRVELARVYRDMRARRLSTADGTKFAYVLGMLAKITEVATVEARLIELEREMQRLRGLGYDKRK